MKIQILLSALIVSSAYGFGLTTSCQKRGLENLSYDLLKKSQIIDSGYISDEKGRDRATCGPDQVGYGGQCRGKYCDDFLWKCSGVTDPLGRKYKVTGLSDFTRKTSDGRPPAICNRNRVMVGVDCDGRYCDDMKIQCASLEFADYAPEILADSEIQFAETPEEGCEWTPYFSEENLGESCPAGSFPRGLACEGRFCDDVAIYCCKGKHLACGRSEHSYFN